MPPSQREGDREAVVGVAKVRPVNSFDCICEGTSSQTQSSHMFHPTFDTPSVSFADSSLWEGAWQLKAHSIKIAK